MKKKKIIYPIVVCVICLILAAALIVGNVACYLNQNIITSYLCGDGLDDDGEQATAARVSGNALAEDVEEEGAVLLKNNGALPLQNTKVNVFGWTGSDDGYIVQGTGSGTGSRNDLVTFLGGLTEAGIEYNTDLAEAYDNLGWARVEGGSYVIEASTEAKYKSYYGVTEAPESFYTDSLMKNAVNYSDTAIVVIGRIMGEGNDYSHIQYINGGDNDESKKLQSLSDLEEYMLDIVTANFDKVIVVINSTNPIECGFADNSSIDAVLYIGTPGTRGAIGVANILKGTVSPSGHLSDTWAYDLSTAASYANSGREGVGSYLDISTDTTLSTRQNKYSEYLEGIYTGYYWYETADAEGFWETSYAEDLWDISDGYNDVVQYPFGYGLSYTSFDWVVSDSNISDGTVLEEDGTIEIEVKVYNTGDVAGKEVVQLYYSAPYYEGGIEKSSIKLAAFAKTTTLQPGEYETLTLSFDVEDMKSYDCYDSNNNGIMGYELEAGNYTISLRSDVHTLKTNTEYKSVNEYTVTVEDDIYYATDDATGETVENQFTTYKNTTSGASSTINEIWSTSAHSIDGADNDDTLTYLTRADFEGTFPEEKSANKNAGSLISDVHNLPSSPVVNDEDEAPEFDSKETSWTLTDLYGVDYDDEMWDELVSQLSLNTCALLIAQGGFGTIAIDSIGKPATYDTDGPTGFNNNVTGTNNLKAVCYPSSTVLAQTWNWYMAYEVGVAIGIEANALGIDGWYGPGANLHRSPLGGRNFEYYSEDGLLSGIMCAYEVNGAKEQGIQVYIKHIGPNECDSGRNGAYKWLTEQSLRENYLKPFELAVKIGGANGLMASVDRVGGARVSGSYALLTAVVRDEWGFNGTVITDYYQGGIVNDVDESVRAGCSQVLHPDLTASLFDDLTSNTAKKYIHKSAKDILYAYVDTHYYAETAQGLESGSLVSTAKDVYAWWIPLLIGVDVLSAGLMALWIVLAVRSVNKKPKGSKKIKDSKIE